MKFRNACPRRALELPNHRQITCKVEKCRLEDINSVFDKMHHFKLSGRVVIDFTTQ